MVADQLGDHLIEIVIRSPSPPWFRKKKLLSLALSLGTSVATGGSPPWDSRKQQEIKINQVTGALSGCISKKRWLVMAIDGGGCDGFLQGFPWVLDGSNLSPNLFKYGLIFDPPMPLDTQNRRRSVVPGLHLPWVSPVVGSCNRLRVAQDFEADLKQHCLGRLRKLKLPWLRIFHDSKIDT